MSETTKDEQHNDFHDSSRSKFSDYLWGTGRTRSATISMQDHDPVRRVVIAGGGTAGWMAAARLAKTMGSTLEIQLVESTEIGIVGVGEATIPPIRDFHELLGLDEDDLLRRVQGTFKLGIQFCGWGQPGDCYMHTFGQVGRTDLGPGDFHQYWLRAVREGYAGRFGDYSFNETAAQANRFIRMDKIPHSSLPGIAYAFHFDARLYARYLREFSEALGVTRIEGRIVEVKRRPADGFIEALVLADSQRVEGDLFIDCTGFRGLLIEQTLGTGYEDWTHWLPCDRAVVVASEPVRPLRCFTQAFARDAGWQWRIPLQHRVGNGHVYCSRYMSDDEATATLLENLDGQPLEEPRLLRFTTGRRKKFWNRNCVALGLASGFMEPLESTSIHLIQAGIRRLVQLFPDRHFEQANIDEYNRQCQFDFERIRDFLILHYIANEKDLPFWRDCRNSLAPEPLNHRLALFSAGGSVYRELGELFSQPSWVQVMLGQNLVPRGHNSIVDGIPAAELQQQLVDLTTIIRFTVQQMPGHEEFLGTHCAAPSPERV